MSNGSPIGFYKPGTGLLHRSPVWLKLLALLMGAILLAVFQGPLSTSVAIVAVATLILLTRVGLRDLWRMIRGFWILLLILFGFHALFSGFLHAYTIVGALFALIIAANLITVTTPTWALLDTLTKLLTPLKIFGIKPESVAFAVSLMLRMIPLIFDVARETREAAKARGLERSPRALLIPLVIRTVKQATELGDALTARGLP